MYVLTTVESEVELRAVLYTQSFHYQVGAHEEPNCLQERKKKKIKIATLVVLHHFLGDKELNLLLGYHMDRQWLIRSDVPKKITN